MQIYETADRYNSAGTAGSYPAELDRVPLAVLRKKVFGDDGFRVQPGMRGTPWYNAFMARAEQIEHGAYPEALNSFPFEELRHKVLDDAGRVRLEMFGSVWHRCYMHRRRAELLKELRGE